MRVNEKRIEYIDFFRGIGILLMIMGHTNSFGWIFDKFIHAFHVPMFFFVSGYLFKEDIFNFKHIIIKKIKTLLLPYFVFGLLHILRAILLTHAILPDYFLRLLLWSTEGMPVPGTCWFLIVLFWAEIIYYAIRYKIKSIKIMNLVVILLTICGMLVKIIGLQVPWGIDVSFVAIGLMHMGYIGKHNAFMKRTMSMQLFPCIIVGSCIAISIMYNAGINMRTSEYGIFLLFWINSIGSCCVGISISKILIQLQQTVAWFKYIKNYLCHIGRNSIVYLCCNQLIIEGIKGFFHQNMYLKGVLILGVTLVVCRICCVIFCNTRLKILIGK